MRPSTMIKLTNWMIGVLLICLFAGTFTTGRIGDLFNVAFLLSCTVVGILVIYGPPDATSPYWKLWEQAQERNRPC
ncbi:MAG: hypothetical protein V4474_01700 [Patescibacteria group bacterium]